MDEKIAMLESEVASLQKKVLALSAQVADLSGQLGGRKSTQNAGSWGVVLSEKTARAEDVCALQFCSGMVSGRDFEVTDPPIEQFKKRLDGIMDVNVFLDELAKVMEEFRAKRQVWKLTSHGPLTGRPI